jgi:hypothetical protein
LGKINALDGTHTQFERDHNDTLADIAKLDNDIVSSVSFELIIRPGARCPIGVLDNLGAGLIDRSDVGGRGSQNGTSGPELVDRTAIDNRPQP